MFGGSKALRGWRRWAGFDMMVASNPN